MLAAAGLACVWLAYSGPGYVDSPNFFSFLALLALMLPFFLATFELAMPGPSARYAAGFGVVWYGLNPANSVALTNFTSRPMVWSALGMVAGLVLYQWRPGWRKYCIYLLPVAAAACMYRATLAFAPLLFAYAVLVEGHGRWRDLPGIFLRCIPAALVSGSTLVLVRAGPGVPGETPAAAAAQALSAFLVPFGPSGPSESGAGLVFVILIGAAVSTAVWRGSRGVSFGLWWFLILTVAAPGETLAASIGLALSASVALALAVGRLSEAHRRWVPVGCAGLLIVTAAASGQTIDFLTTKVNHAKLRSRDPVQWLEMSTLYYQVGNYRGSIWAARTAVCLKPDQASTYNNLGAGFAALQKWDEAVQAFEESLKLNPNQTVTKENLARAQEQQRLQSR